MILRRSSSFNSFLTCLNQPETAPKNARKLRCKAVNFERYKIEKERAKQRLREAGKIGRAIQLGVASPDATPKFEGKVSEIIASYAGVGTRTVERALTVFKHGDMETVQKMLKGASFTFPSRIFFAALGLISLTLSTALANS